MGTVLKKVRWTDVLAFLSRLDLISLCATNREYSEICSLIFHGIRRDDVEDKNDHNVKDLRIRWNRANNENKIEVWRGFPVGYETVPFPEIKPPAFIKGFKEIVICRLICPQTLRFLELSKSLLSGSELVITDFTDFCDVHNVRLVDDFLSVFSGAFRIELDNCSAETESFLGHETILGITSSDITKILYVINSFSDCSHLSLFDVNPDYNIEVIVDWLHYQHPVSPTQMHSLAEKHHAPKNSGKVLQLDANNYIGDFLEKAIEYFRAASMLSISYSVKIFNMRMPGVNEFELMNEKNSDKLVLKHYASLCNDFYILKRFPFQNGCGNLETAFNSVDDEERTKVVVQLDDEV